VEIGRRTSGELNGGIPPAELSGPAFGHGLVAVIDLDSIEPGDVEPLARAVAITDRIAIGLAHGAIPSALEPLTTRLDVALSDAEAGHPAVQVEDLELALNELVTSISARPLAAYTLIHALRAVSLLPIRPALSVESAAYSVLLAGPEFRAWLESAPATAPDSRRQTLRVARDEDTLSIVLARPAKRNALSSAMRDELVEALTLAVLDRSIRSLRISGEGPCFCSGGDLREFGSAPDAATAHVVRMLQSPALLLSEVADRTTCHVHGPCIGAGVELPAFAGTVVAAPDATFQLPELSMGLIPGAGGTVSLTRRLGRSRTAWLALSGQTIDASLALDWGLVDRIDDT
jgi:enoyl-CoA hydratase/carnithine racemase